MQVAPEDDPLAIDPDVTERWLVRFLQEEVRDRRRFDRVLVGISGGVDSATTAALACRAFGAARVLGVRMPYRTSSPESGEHAEQLAKHLGMELQTVDISTAVDGFFASLGEEGDATRRGNVMARMRMITLFDLSAKLRALPLGAARRRSPAWSPTMVPS